MQKFRRRGELGVLKEISKEQMSKFPSVLIDSRSSTMADPKMLETKHHKDNKMKLSKSLLSKQTPHSDSRKVKKGCCQQCLEIFGLYPKVIKEDYQNFNK